MVFTVTDHQLIRSRVVIDGMAGHELPVCRTFTPKGIARVFAFGGKHMNQRTAVTVRHKDVGRTRWCTEPSGFVGQKFTVVVGWSFDCPDDVAFHVCFVQHLVVVGMVQERGLTGTFVGQTQTMGGAGTEFSTGTKTCTTSTVRVPFDHAMGVVGIGFVRENNVVIVVQGQAMVIFGGEMSRYLKQMGHVLVAVRGGARDDWGSCSSGGNGHGGKQEGGWVYHLPTSWPIHD